MEGILTNVMLKFAKKIVDKKMFKKVNNACVDFVSIIKLQNMKWWSQKDQHMCNFLLLRCNTMFTISMQYFYFYADTWPFADLTAR